MESPPASLLNLLALYKSFHPKFISSTSTSTSSSFVNLNAVGVECITQVMERKKWKEKACKILRRSEEEEDGEVSTSLFDEFSRRSY